MLKLISLIGFGYAKKTSIYDDRGNMIEFACYGVDGSPCLSNSGYAKCTMKYDDRNNVIEKLYYDIEGNQIAMSDAVTVMEGGKAYLYGLRGTYYVLEYCDWNIGSQANISSEYFSEMRYRYKHMLLLNENGIVEYAESGLLGMSFHVVPCSLEDKKMIVNLYEEWKAKNRKE